ncbi:hypothetical protein [Phyllobacterium sp. A18/5-2]|nr:hypothetical protein [Phyllobacterium sp. A18/5-2]
MSARRGSVPGGHRVDQLLAADMPSTGHTALALVAAFAQWK